jgi:8-oxo-dGTP pyrophosphatase MutT (NUDIX family)
MDYRLKYLKYKYKYLNLQNQFGGAHNACDKGARNACVALLYNNNIYLVKNRKKKWNIPGGVIDPGESSLTAAFREFREETGGFDLDIWAPKLRTEIHYYNFHGHTDIWWYVSSTDPTIRFEKNTEMTDGKWYNINALPSYGDLRFPKSIYATISHIKDQLSKPVAPYIIKTPVSGPVKEIKLTYICIPNEMGKYPTREACEKASD